jgi:HEAT repeat protein
MISAHFRSTLTLVAATMLFASVASAAPQGKLTPRTNAQYILRGGIKAADFTARGMAYRGLVFDRSNKDLVKQLEDGTQDPQWAVRKGVAEAFYAIGNAKWKQVIKDALALPVLNPYDVLPTLDTIPDAQAFAVLVESLSDTEHSQQDKIMAALVGRNRPNLGGFLKLAVASKAPLARQTGLKGVAALDPVLQAAHLDVVAKGHAGDDEVIRILVDVGAAADERVALQFLASVKPKDASLANRIVVLRALHGDKGVSKALLKVCQTETAEAQIAALEAYKKVADKADAPALKVLVESAANPQLVFVLYEILARLGDRSLAAEALKLAESTDVEVRASGVFYLGWVGGAGRLGEMHDYLRDGIPSVRIAAARVVGYIASPVSVVPLRDRLDKERDDGVRIELIKALASIKHRDAYEGLMFYTREKNTELRQIVVRALAESGESLARPGLQNALNDSDVHIRTEAVRGFLLSDIAEAVKVWRRSLQWLPRGALLDLTRELGKTMEGFIEIGLFETRNDEAGVALREEAFIALQLLPQAQGPMLRKVEQITEDDDLRIRVLTRLFELEGSKVAVEIKTLAMSQSPRARIAGLRLLGKLKGDKEARDILEKALDEADERIRIAAALTYLGG